MLVLIVDDDPMTRLLCERMVAGLGYETLKAPDGESAWALCQTRAPDVIISDWMMPGLSGVDLCQRVRAFPGPSYTYFVLLTSLNEREDFLTGMRAGADDYLTKPLDREQLQVRLISAARVTDLHRELSAQRSELLLLNERLFNEGRRDALTGLGNRLRLREDLQVLGERCSRHRHRAVLTMMDVDHFKKYNDCCGHLAGDQVLRRVAETLSAASRGTDTLYRYGGEEFLVVLAEVDLELALRAAERLRGAVEAQRIPHPALGAEAVVTLSVGLASLHGQAVEEAIREADQALYQAKAAGRNRVVAARPQSP